MKTAGKICFFSFNLLLLAVILAGCHLAASNQQQPKAMPTKPEAAKNRPMNKQANPKIVMVVAPRDFRDEEYFQPRQVFDQAGFEVTVASIQGGQAISAAGKTIAIDKTVSEIKPTEYAAVVFVGGPGMAEIVKDDSLAQLARQFYQAQKIVAAICVAPAILARAGLVAGKQVTSWSGVRADLEQAGAQWQAKPVVVAGRLITGAGPQAAEQFGQVVRDQVLANR